MLLDQRVALAQHGVIVVSLVVPHHHVALDLDGLAVHVELGNKGRHAVLSPHTVVEVLHQRLRGRQRLHECALAKERLPRQVHNAGADLKVRTYVRM